MSDPVFAGSNLDIDLEGYFDYLRSIDEELTSILEDNFAKFSEVTSAEGRKASRVEFNQNVKRALEKTLADRDGGSK